MKIIRSLAIAAFVSTAFVVACSSDDSSSSSAASSCADAKKVADDCNAKPQEGGVSVKITFDQSKCESAGDQGKKAADCIVAHKDNCDCFVSCQLNGTCQ